MFRRAWLILATLGIACTQPKPDDPLAPRGSGDAASDAADGTGLGGERCPAVCPAATPVCSTGACRAVKRIAPGHTHACALIDDGTVRCWGANDDGRLGDGTKDRRATPGPGLVGVADVVQLATGTDHSCAVTENGSVWCWGSNDHGQLGVPEANPRLPVRVQGL